MTTASHPLRAKLIYNAQAGPSAESAQQLAEIMAALRGHQIVPDVFAVRPHSRIDAAVRRAIRAGTRLIVVAGGDGTVDTAVQGMVGSSATLGIIPIGTRNNIALSLNIPDAIADAAALLRAGRQRWIDVGHVRRGRANRWFVETVTLGLLSALYPAADDIQHGNPTRIPDLLATFVSFTPSRLHLALDEHDLLEATAHVALVANMPFLGPNFQIDPDVACDDGLLDLFIFSDMNKLNLIAYAAQRLTGPVEDANVKHYRVKHLKLHATPPMPVLVDGTLVGEDPITVQIRPRGLKVMSGAAPEDETAVHG